MRICFFSCNDKDDSITKKILKPKHKKQKQKPTKQKQKKKEKKANKKTQLKKKRKQQLIIFFPLKRNHLKIKRNSVHFQLSLFNIF